MTAEQQQRERLTNLPATSENCIMIATARPRGLPRNRATAWPAGLATACLVAAARPRCLTTKRPRNERHVKRFNVASRAPTQGPPGTHLPGARGGRWQRRRTRCHLAAARLEVNTAGGNSA